MSYSTVSGDTFDSISRKVYGEESGAARIRGANPGVIEPIPVGIQLVIPPGQETSPQEQVDDNPSGISLTIGGRRFRFWSSVTVTRRFDSVDTISVTAPWEPDRPGWRQIFRPFSYQRVAVRIGGSPLFTGTTLDVAPTLEASQRVATVTGYGLPGVLWDCTMPVGSFPLEYDRQNLQQIANATAAVFGLSVVFEADPGAPFDRVALNPDDRPGLWLANLARQRNLVIGSNADGALVFRQDEPTAGTPVVRLVSGVQPVSEVTPKFNPQEYFSHITGIEPALFGIPGEKFSQTIAGVDAVRPSTFTVTDAVDGSLQTAVQAKAARMFANAATYQVALPTWFAPGGELWEPGQFVQLEAPDAMVYSPYTFTIREVSLERDKLNERAVLTLMIPGSFAGVVPTVLPWD